MDPGDENDAGGILTVAETVTEYGHAVNRDLISLGYRSDDDLIALGDVVSIVLASQTGTAVRYAAEKGWSQTDILLAQHNENALGVSYDRPGVEAATPAPIRGDGTANWTPQTIDEFTERRNRLAGRFTEESERSIAKEARHVV